MAKKIDKPEGKDRLLDTPEQVVDSGKVLSAFRDAKEGRRDTHDLDAAPIRHKAEQRAEDLGDVAPDLNSESVAQEFLTLTGARHSHALENKPAVERFRLGQRRSGPSRKR